MAMVLLLRYVPLRAAHLAPCRPLTAAAVAADGAAGVLCLRVWRVAGEVEIAVGRVSGEVAGRGGWRWC